MVVGVIVLVVVAVLALMCMGLLAALAMRLLQLLAALMLAVLGAAVLIGIAAIITAIAMHAGAAEPVALLAGIAIMVLAGLAMRAAWSGRTARIVAPEPEPMMAEPTGYEQVAAAWEQAAQLAPGAWAELRRARDGCARLLMLAGRSHQDELPLVTHQVPGLVADYAGLIADAGRAEARDMGHRMVDQLVAIGARAREIVEAEREQRGEALAVRELHVARRLGRGGL